MLSTLPTETVGPPVQPVADEVAPPLRIFFNATNQEKSLPSGHPEPSGLEGTVHKGIPKSLLSLGLLLATGLMFGACDQGLTDPEDQETAPINFVAYAVGIPVSTIVIDVSADDIKGKLVFNLQFNEDFVASGLLQVPVGEQRLFSVKTYDDQHNLTHTGEATIDVQPGSNPPLQVKLKPVAGEVEIRVSLGDYAVIVAPAAATIDASGGGTTLQLEVTVLDQYGEEVIDPQVQWATTLPTVATVSPTGLVTGLADGVVDIVASYGGVAGLSKVTLANFGGGPSPPATFVNGNFDSGSGVGWTEESAHGWPLIVHSDEIYDRMKPLPSEPYAAWLGGFEEADDIVFQDVYIPAEYNGFQLTGYRYLETGETPAQLDWVRIEVWTPSGTPVEWLAEWWSDAPTTGWESFSISTVGDYSDQTVRLVIHGMCHILNVSNFLFDSLELTLTSY